MFALSRPTRRWALALCGWTLFTWVTRVPLAWSDAELEPAEKVLATVPVLLFVVLAGVTGALVLTRRPAAAASVLGLAGWTLAYWAVRMTFIATNGHALGFVVVHAVLALVAGTLSVLTLRTAWADRSQGSDGGPGVPQGSDGGRAEGRLPV